MPPELIVAQDIVQAAFDVFMEAAPRAIALAGGSTPRPFYERLAAHAYPWSQVDVFFGDERLVPLDHPDSNFRMANEALLSKVPARAHPMQEARSYEQELRAGPPLELAVLGLGPDGHTASLFPGDEALEERERWVVRVERPDHPRLTLTLPVLSAVPLVLFLVAGETKRAALHRLMADDTSIPASRVRPARAVVVADRAAAG